MHTILLLLALRLNYLKHYAKNILYFIAHSSSFIHYIL
jgi:hypothetical protein